MWRKVESINPSMCQECKKFHKTTWNWFPDPTLSTVCYCEQCVTVLLSDSKGN